MEQLLEKHHKGCFLKSVTFFLTYRSQSKRATKFCIIATPNPNNAPHRIIEITSSIAPLLLHEIQQIVFQVTEFSRPLVSQRFVQYDPRRKN